ncbi:CGNR zinc finger domain-containing protein [Nocardia sp. CA-135953]
MDELSCSGVTHHSRNRGRTWCSMDVCGNRVKVRASHRRNATR